MQSKYLGAVKHEQCVNSDEDEAYGYLTSAVDPHARLSRVDWHFLVGCRTGILQSLSEARLVGKKFATVTSNFRTHTLSIKYR